MKAINIRYVLAAAAVLSLASCVKEAEPVAKDPADCMGVYFLEEQENAKTHTLEKGIDKTSLEIIVRRSNAEKEEDITYKAVNVSVDEKIYTNSTDLSAYLLYGDTYEEKIVLIEEYILPQLNYIIECLKANRKIKK